MWQLLLVCALLGSGHAQMVEQSGPTPLPDNTQTCKYGAPSPNRGRGFRFHNALVSVTAVADSTKILNSLFTLSHIEGAIISSETTQIKYFFVVRFFKYFSQQNMYWQHIKMIPMPCQYIFYRNTENN